MACHDHFPLSKPFLVPNLSPFRPFYYINRHSFWNKQENSEVYRAHWWICFFDWDNPSEITQADQALWSLDFCDKTNHL